MVEIMLMGEFHHNIDDKKRMIIPSKFRYELGNEVVVTRGLDNCLFIYSLKEWQKVIDKLNTLSFTKKDARSFTRIFLSGAVITEFDKQGRIKLPGMLAEYANLTKECAIIGVNERLEIWNLDSWNTYLNSNSETITTAVETLFENNEN